MRILCNHQQEGHGPNGLDLLILALSVSIILAARAVHSTLAKPQTVLLCRLRDAMPGWHQLLDLALQARYLAKQGITLFVCNLQTTASPLILTYARRSHAFS